MATNNPYQVKQEDKDFLTLAANLGVDYNRLRQANPYVQSISTGQYINMPVSSPNPNNVFAPAVNAGSVTGSNVYRAPVSNQSAMNAFRQQETFYNRAPPTPRPSNPAVLNQGVIPSVAFIGRFEDGSPVPASTANPSAMTAFRTQENITNQVTALDQFYQQNGYLPPNIPPAVKAAMIAQGANPAAIQQAQQAGVGQSPTGAASDPLAGTPGHYYVDEQTAPFVGRIITVNGKRRILRADKEGRLYYQKPGQSKRGRAINRDRRREAAVAQQAAQAAAAAAAQQVLPTPDVNYRDAPVTALSVVLGS